MVNEQNPVQEEQIIALRSLLQTCKDELLGLRDSVDDITKKLHLERGEVLTPDQDLAIIRNALSLIPKCLHILLFHGQLA